MRDLSAVFAAIVLLVGVCSICFGFDWQVEKVTQSIYTSAPSLVIAPDGTPHIAFFDSTNSMLRYAHRSGGVWRTEAIQTMSG